MIHINSRISTFITPIALALLVWRTVVEDRMLRRDLPGYADYAARVPHRLVPGVCELAPRNCAQAMSDFKIH